MCRFVTITEVAAFLSIAWAGTSTNHELFRTPSWATRRNDLVPAPKLCIMVGYARGTLGTAIALTWAEGEV
jgi:hypothetical protein